MVKKVLFLTTLLAILASGCKPGASAPVTETASAVPANTPIPTDTPFPPTPTPTPTETPLPPTPTPTPTETPVPPTPTPELPRESGLEANPQRVEFQAQDGTQLVGYYYPSRFADAHIIVLAHWAGGNQRDWVEIAMWLQNRRDEVTEYPQPTDDTSLGPWLDPSWFPPMPADVSFAVFTFDFRGFGESASGAWEDMLQDAQAAFETAAEMEGIDPQRMAGIGASIGADGAPGGCLLYNQTQGGGCLGAMALSPGNYLVDFASVVEQLEALDPQAEVWCLADKEDEAAYTTCKPISGDLYQFYVFQNAGHGMMLIRPKVEPQPLVLIQQFLGELFGIPSLKGSKTR